MLNYFRFAECCKHLTEELFSNGKVNDLRSRENIDKGALFGTNKRVNGYNASVLASKVRIDFEANDTAVSTALSQE